jgi:hypothetical protein
MALARTLEEKDTVRWRSPFYFTLESGVVIEIIEDGRRLPNTSLDPPVVVVGLDRGGRVFSSPSDLERITAD